MGAISSIGDILGFGDLVGKKPVVPPLKLPSISGAQSDAAAGNLAVLPVSEQTGSLVDKYNLDQFSKALDFWFPGGLSKIQGILGNQLGGQLSPETSSSVIRNATAAGYGRGGSYGSQYAGQFGRNLVARDLGITAEGQQQQGMQNLRSLYSMTPKAYDPTSLFMTSQQRLAAETQQSEDTFSHDWLQAQVAAAPSPLGQFIQNVVYAIAGTAGRYFGVSGGGGKPVNSTSAGPGAGGTGFYMDSSAGSGYADSASGGFLDSNQGFA